MSSEITSAKITHGTNGNGEALVHINVRGLTLPPHTGSFKYNEGTFFWLERITGQRQVELPKKVQRFLVKAPRGYVCILSDEWAGYAEFTLTYGGDSVFEWHNHNP